MVPRTPPMNQLSGPVQLDPVAGLVELAVELRGVLQAHGALVILPLKAE